MTPNPSLQLTFASRLRRLAPAGELKRYASFVWRLRIVNAADLSGMSPEFVLSAPATAEEILELEGWFGSKLPLQLMELLRVSNGISFRNPYLPPDFRTEEWVHSCANIIKMSAVTRTILQDNKASWAESGRPDLLGDVNRYLFFASTWNGDMCAFLRDGDAGAFRLVVIDHETGVVEDVETQDLFELLPQLDPYSDGR
jgi:hypothetical protein